MMQWTTPTHTFTLPISVDLIDEIRITYSQNGAIVVKKFTKDCRLNGNNVSVTLTQEDTGKFDDKLNVAIQVRYLTSGGNVQASREIIIDCGRVLDSEVLT